MYLNFLRLLTIQVVLVPYLFVRDCIVGPLSTNPQCSGIAGVGASTATRLTVWEPQLLLRLFRLSTVGLLGKIIVLMCCRPHWASILDVCSVLVSVPLVICACFCITTAQGSGLCSTMHTVHDLFWFWGWGLRACKLFRARIVPNLSTK